MDANLFKNLVTLFAYGTLMNVILTVAYFTMCSCIIKIERILEANKALAVK